MRYKKQHPQSFFKIKRLQSTIILSTYKTRKIERSPKQFTPSLSKEIEATCQYPSLSEGTKTKNLRGPTMAVQH
jgi:hypothetical protein